MEFDTAKTYRDNDGDLWNYRNGSWGYAAPNSGVRYDGKPTPFENAGPYEVVSVDYVAGMTIEGPASGRTYTRDANGYWERSDHGNGGFEDEYVKGWPQETLKGPAAPKIELGSVIVDCGGDRFVCVQDSSVEAAFVSVRSYALETGDTLTVHLHSDLALTEPALQEPEKIGSQVEDDEQVLWIRGTNGWLCADEEIGVASEVTSWADLVQYGPLTLVEG